MKKMKRYEDGGDVDYDKDSDSEAQKVYRADLTEVSDSERMPKRSAPAKKATKKDDGSYDRKEQRRAMFSGFDEPSKKKPTFGETMRKRAKDVMGLKTGGSVKSSASRRADGIAQRGKTKGRMI